MSRNFALSFEFFPPKTPAGEEKLTATRAELAKLDPDYFSVTYGAGGSTRNNTRAVVLDTRAAGLEVAAHLSFGSDSPEAIRGLLDAYREAGVSRILALRGDIPEGMSGDGKLTHANELVQFIREHYGQDFRIHVAAYPEIHPEARGYDDDVHWLGEKFRAGADCAITQYFYNIDAYWYFLDHAAKAGITKPIVPGIMPITRFDSLARFSAACGAEIPRWLTKRLEDYADDEPSLAAFGQEVMTKMCEKLLAGGAPGLHFYTMNHAAPSCGILAGIGIH